MKAIKLLYKYLPVITIALLITVMVNPMTADAAAVSVTVSSPSNGEFAASTDTDVTFGYTTSATEFASGDSISIIISPAVSSALTDCSSATTDADGDTANDGALGSFSTGGATYTFDQATTTAASGGIDICLNFQDDTAAGMYSISLTDDNDSDYGAALIYVGDDNDVSVTAEVSPLLSFAIRNSSDTGDTNSCDLGTLVTTAVNTCAYRLKPASNAASGYTVQITSDGDLERSGGSGDAYNVDPISEGSTVTAGTEGYGIALNGGGASIGSITESGDFSDDDTPIPTSATNLYTASGPNAPSSTDTTNTALVTHRATMDGLTYTGNYSQTVTYYVSASF